MASLIAGDVAAYLERRGLLAEARTDGWFALPAPGDTQAAWIGILGDVFPAELLAGSGLFWRKGDTFTFAHPANRLCIPWRTPDGLVYTIQRRRLDAGEPKYVFPLGRSARWPYGIECLAEVSPGAPIVFCEGAVDVLARRILDRGQGFERVSLGVPGGGWRPEWAELARGRAAFVAPDADAAGARAAERWAADLYAAGALDVKRIEPVGARDWAEVVA